MADEIRIVAVLDACVLAPMPIADTLLRLAENPDFYSPRWSLQILEELSRTLLKFGLAPLQIERRIRMMTAGFPEALAENFDELIPSMDNDPKDRHVLAAAVSSGANVIVSDNRRHFPAASLVPHKLVCLTPDAFLAELFSIDPVRFTHILTKQASDIQRTLPELLARHAPSLRELVELRSTGQAKSVSYLTPKVSRVLSKRSMRS